MKNPLVFRPIQTLTYAFFGLIAAGLALSAYLTFHQQQLINELIDELTQREAFDRTHVIATRLAIQLGKDATSNDAVRRELLARIDDLKRLAAEPDSPKTLQVFRAFVEQLEPGHYEVILDRVSILQEVDLREEDGEVVRLARLSQQMKTQLHLDIIMPVALILFAAVIFPLSRRRIIKPLEAFGRLLTRLGGGDFTPAPVDEDVDWVLLPLHRQYNELTRRLQTLEAAHEAREDTLEREVRTATKTLLEQRHSLARAERLAATGELAASVAHELRNPLAGIQMTLSNLRTELKDAEAAQRIDLVIGEVQRLTRLLNQLLDSARHAPEAARPIELGRLVDEVVSLARYQIPAEVRLEHHSDPGLTCVLPADGLRQVILNLVLNAAAAIGEKPGTITISGVGEGERVRLTVNDDGPGFPPEVLQQGARPFLSRREHGTGLGLAMVRRFVRDVGGELSLANRKPRGASVTLLLPRKVQS